MKSSDDENNKFVLCFSDIVSIFKKSSKKILFFAISLALIAMVYSLTRPISYQSEGSLREKNSKGASFSGNTPLQYLLNSGGLQGAGGESEALTIIKSRKLLSQVIDQLHLQGRIEAQVDREGLFTRIKQNLLLIKSAATGKKYPVLTDICCPLKFTSLSYQGELQKSFVLKLHLDGHFDLLDSQNLQKKIGTGVLGKKFETQEFSFTLAKADLKIPLTAQTFDFSLTPLFDVFQGVSKNLQVEPYKTDKSLLILTYQDRNRHLASDFINAVMGAFQSFLKDHHSLVAYQQLEYLNQRRDDLTTNLKDLMKQHANYLSNDLYSAGFIDSEKEMQFLAERQHEYKEKLLANELEIKRLENMTPGSVAYYDRYSPREGDPAVINQMLGEIRKLKQQRDTLEIELQKKSLTHSQNLQQTFDQEIDELALVQKYIVQLGVVKEQYKQNKPVSFDLELLNDKRFSLRGWFERLENVKAADSSNLKKIEDNFEFYLMNLERLMNVHEHVLQERLIYQQNPSGEYQGINLEAATELYLDYSKQMIQTEANIRQNLFFIHQMEDPNFEITSLSSGLNDQISREMINRSSQLVLNLRDSNNQSSKEQERIKDELNLQRTFLAMHLEQMIQLMELNKQLIDEKVFALLNVSLNLIHQQISLIEKNLQEYVQSRLQNLRQERGLIKGHLESIQTEMAALPAKWVSEQLIQQEVDSNKLIVEEIAKMVESKNISHNIEVIQSAPLDQAVASLHPQTPKIVLWGFLGFFLGTCIGSALTIGETIKKGLPVSCDNLREMGFHVSGSVSSSFALAGGAACQSDWETMRRLQAYFERDDSNEKQYFLKTHTLLLIDGKASHYASSLAKLYRIQGMSVLLIDCPLDENASGAPKFSPVHFSDASSLPIEQNGVDLRECDYLKGITLDAINSASFQKILIQLRSQYDYIIISSKISPLSAKAEVLVPLFSLVAVSFTDEKVEDLHFYRTFIDKNCFSAISCLLVVDENKWI